MTPDDLKERTTAWAVQIVNLCRQLRQAAAARNIADQLSDSATAVASNYRNACRARSHREFVSKLGVALEEADESVGWLEIIGRSKLEESSNLDELLKEARELLAILAASRRTAERREGGRR